MLRTMRNFILMTAAVALLGACTTHPNVDNSKKDSLILVLWLSV